jgi:hypothetical protein
VGPFLDADFLRGVGPFYAPITTSVVEELQRWATIGLSCFERLLKKLKLPARPAATPVLDQLFPKAGPQAIPTG